MVKSWFVEKLLKPDDRARYAWKAKPNVGVNNRNGIDKLPNK